MKFYRNEQIEQIAEQRLSEFQQKLRAASFVSDRHRAFRRSGFGAIYAVGEIEEMPGEEVLAGLRASDRLIVMNERRKDEMEQKPGRRRLTQGHEMGHWDLFVRISKLDHPELFDAAASGVIAGRSATGGQVQILLCSEQGHDICAKSMPARTRPMRLAPSIGTLRRFDAALRFRRESPQDGPDAMEKSL